MAARYGQKTMLWSKFSEDLAFKFNASTVESLPLIIVHGKSEGDTAAIGVHAEHGEERTKTGTEIPNNLFL
jgi:hypothetical protein